MQTKTIVDVPGIEVGHAQNEATLTGCTVVLARDGAVGGVDVRGSAPGTRETDLLHPVNVVDRVHAICLTGGSAFGLAAADGVMNYLEKKRIGLNTGFGIVPIVPAAALYDLSLGDSSVRPDAKMGFDAVSKASKQKVQEGNIGAGCGASVGKLGGFDRAMKGGLGTASRILENGLVIGAIVAVNAVGEVRDPLTNEVLAGVRDENGAIRKIEHFLTNQVFSPIPTGTNTTIAVVASNAILTKSQVNKVAQMSHNGLARTIYPVHTMNDGDTIFSLATGEVKVPVDVVGTLCADVLTEAVVRAIRAAKGAGGLPAYCEIKQQG